jgi:hypothetical protein
MARDFEEQAFHE